MAVESPAVIRKHPEDAPLLPNMPDLEAARRTFTWDAARAELDGLPGGGLNIAHEAVDRHAAGPHASRDTPATRELIIALPPRAADGERGAITSQRCQRQ